jgi:hypothetical protein
VHRLLQDDGLDQAPHGLKTFRRAVLLHEDIAEPLLCLPELGGTHRRAAVGRRMLLVSCSTRPGSGIAAVIWQFMARCYANTFRAHPVI